MISHASELYLDLMTKILTNTIYGDAPIDHWTGGRYDAETRHLGRDWPGVAHTMVGTERLQNLRRVCELALQEQIPGDFIETGVWRGGACILMRAVLKVYGVTDRDVVVADSFEGLPPPNAARYPRDEGDVHHSFKQLAVSADEVRENFARYGLLDEQCVFLEGFFRDTLPRVKDRTFALIRLDGDMYESTFQALEALYPRVSPSGFVVIDDYQNIESCRTAVHDYLAQNHLNVSIQQIDGSGVWWRKDDATRSMEIAPAKPLNAPLTVHDLTARLSKAQHKFDSSIERQKILIDEIGVMRAHQGRLEESLALSGKEIADLKEKLQAEQDLKRQLAGSLESEVQASQRLVTRYATLEGNNNRMVAQAKGLEENVRRMLVSGNIASAAHGRDPDTIDFLQESAEEAYRLLSDLCQILAPSEAIPLWFEGQEHLKQTADKGRMSLKSALRFTGRRPRLSREAVAVAKSGLFSPSWYVKENADVANSTIPAIVHYIRHGGFENRDPSPLFSSSLYLTNHPDVAAAHINPLVHYVLHGLAEQRSMPPARDAAVTRPSRDVVRRT